MVELDIVDNAVEFKQSGGNHEIPFCGSGDDGNADVAPPIAQSEHGLGRKPRSSSNTSGSDRERAENEKAYNATMKRLKSQAPAATSSDPWKTVRPASEPNAKR